MGCSRDYRAYSKRCSRRYEEREADMLEQIPMPGASADERERRRKWLTLPRKARIAIRKLHNELGHVPQSVLVKILRASRANRNMIDAAKFFKC